MIRFLVGLLLALVTVCSSAADPPSRLNPLMWLAGDWRGIGEGEPGTSASERHVEPILGGHFLRMDGRSVYPKQERNPHGEIHMQMNVWSYDAARDAIVLREFDDLGFAATYVVDKEASSDDRLVLNGEHLENVPQGWRARYTFTFAPPDEFRETLELDADGKGFAPYVSNRYLRIGAPTP